MYKYPSIEQFRNIIKEVKHIYKNEKSLPILSVTGTAKVHGSNASVAIDSNGIQTCQSKSNIITPENDNYGFAAWHSDTDIMGVFKYMGRVISNYYEFDTVIFYGEWAGKGIQKGVAVNDVDKFFYLFDIKIILNGESTWLTSYPKLHMMDLFDNIPIIDSRVVWKKEIKIDFNNPELSQNELISTTEEIEKECPVGKYFKVSGIGEGAVYRVELPEPHKTTLKFKVKSKKHSASKVKTLAAVDVERINTINEFIEYAVTENRLNQALTETCNNIPDIKLLGKFIKWISTDVNKEEQDTLKTNGLTMKDVGSALSAKTKNWFFNK